MIFFTADTHFGHEAIIRYCNRPFKSSEEMDETLITNWNNIVNERDTVYHLGDFAFKNPLLYLERLKGKVVLIRGNHDYKRLKHAWSSFENIHDLLSITIEKTPIVLCHFAMRVWHKSHFNSWQLYGHSHGTLEDYGKTYDVGVDNNNFSPISFKKLKTIMSSKPNNINWLEKLKGFNKSEFQEAQKLIDQGRDLD